MTQKEKQILFQDLCSRLPYGLKIQVYDNRYAPTTLTAIDIKKQECIFGFNVPIENCLPYLRSMSSMTEEESKEFALLQTDFYVDGFLYPIAATGMIDWLNAHHFDYRGLIEKGLAIEAPEGMYKN